MQYKFLLDAGCGTAGRDERWRRSTVRAELDRGVLRITLNRPEKLNSFNEDMHLELRAQLDRAHAEDEVRAVLLTGAGRGFCAGQDLGDRDPRKGGPHPISAIRSKPSTDRTCSPSDASRNPSSARSMASPRGREPISPLPATSFWPRNPRDSSRRSRRSGWFPMPGAAGLWPTFSVSRVPRRWP